MLEQIDITAAEACQKAHDAADLTALDAVRVEYLGRKGVVAALLKQMAALPGDQKPVAGKRLNTLKKTISQALDARNADLGTGPKAVVDAVDVTLPGERPPVGTAHPITQTLDELLRISANLGFETVRGPEVETEWYNFEALNIPLDHPARDGFDTFYLHDDVLLRSHTSPVQIHTLQKRRPPLRVVVPGRVYRPDTVDASHSFMFTQLEGLMVGEQVTFRDLKTVLHQFFQGLYGERIKIRLRPSFFPFTEPSAEVDCSCPFCDGNGCAVCKKKGWIEVAGCGMVDPNVFAAVDLDPDRYTGFAFGMGVDRLCMAKYGINDIRLLTENDIRFLRQF